MYYAKTTDYVKQLVKEDMNTKNWKIRVLLATSAAGMGSILRVSTIQLITGAPEIWILMFSSMAKQLELVDLQCHY